MKYNKIKLPTTGFEPAVTDRFEPAVTDRFDYSTSVGQCSNHSVNVFTAYRLQKVLFI